VSKAALIAAVVGAGLTGIGFEVRALRRPPAAAAGPAPIARLSRTADDRPGRDAETIQGRWIIDEASQAGEALALVLGDRLVIEGQRFHWTAAHGEPERIFRKGTTRGLIGLDRRASPRRVNFVASGRELPGSLAPATAVLGRLQDDALGSSPTIPAIYQLEADGSRLRLCVGDRERPRSFQSEPGSRQLLLVFRREVPGGRRAPAADGSHDASVSTREIPGEFRP
jgi:uncharacterized protein (TIGR03067 family)